jgi:hypothetical protein
MKYRVLRYFDDDPNDLTLIGHYDTKRQASDAIRDDNHKRLGTKVYAILKYKIEEVETELTQKQIDELIKRQKEQQQ